MKTFTEKEVVELFKAFEKGWDNYPNVDIFLKEKGLIEEFEVGWYKDNVNSYLCYHGEGFRYGFDYRGVWLNREDFNTEIYKNEPKATDKEVEEALIREAENQEHVFCNWRFEDGKLYGTNGCLHGSHTWSMVFNNGKWKVRKPKSIEERLTDIEKTIGIK